MTSCVGLVIGQTHTSRDVQPNVHPGTGEVERVGAQVRERVLRSMRSGGATQVSLLSTHAKGRNPDRSLLFR